jgi:hypothetical protein
MHSFPAVFDLSVARGSSCCLPLLFALNFAFVSLSSHPFSRLSTIESPDSLTSPRADSGRTRLVEVAPCLDPRLLALLLLLFSVEALLLSVSCCSVLDLPVFFLSAVLR